MPIFRSPIKDPFLLTNVSQSEDNRSIGVNSLKEEMVIICYPPLKGGNCEVDLPFKVTSTPLKRCGARATAVSGDRPCCRKLWCLSVPLALVLGYILVWGATPRACTACRESGGSAWVQRLTRVHLFSTLLGARCSVPKTPAFFWKGSEQVNCRHETAVWRD